MVKYGIVWQDMTKITLTIPDDLLADFDKYCGMVPRATMVQKLMRYALTEPEADSTGPSTPGPISEVVASVPPVEPMPCFNCKFRTILQLVTYLDGDQIRTANWLCPRCIQKARVSGQFVGEGDLSTR